MDGTTYQIIVESTNVAQLLEQLLAQLRNTRKNFSLSDLCKRSGLASKGYISEIMRGKRLPSPETAQALAKGLGLKGVAVTYVVALAERDAAKSEAERARLDENLAKLRKAIEVKVAPLTVEHHLFGFSIEVFCAFGLFQGRPARSDLIQYFGRDRALEIDRALSGLEKAGFIEKELHAEAENSCRSDPSYNLINSANHYVFREDSKEKRHLEILRQAIEASSQVAHLWFPRKVDSHFEATILSVDHSFYRSALQKFKADLLAWEASLETSQADSLVRINLQIHPLGAPKA